MHIRSLPFPNFTDYETEQNYSVMFNFWHGPRKVPYIPLLYFESTVGCDTHWLVCQFQVTASFVAEDFVMNTFVIHGYLFSLNCPFHQYGYELE